MMKQYIAPQTEEITMTATCELLIGSPAPAPTSVHVVNVNSNITAD